MHVFPRGVFVLEQSLARASTARLSPGRDFLILAASASACETTAAEEDGATERVSIAATVARSRMFLGRDVLVLAEVVVAREIAVAYEDEATEHVPTEAVEAARAAAKKSAVKTPVVLTSTLVGGAMSSAMPVPTTASVAVVTGTPAAAAKSRLAWSLSGALQWHGVLRGHPSVVQIHAPHVGPHS